ncbi:putative U3 small nucleolar RNA-associated protein 7, partial [Coemansia nantahalensis]
MSALSKQARAGKPTQSAKKGADEAPDELALEIKQRMQKYKRDMDSGDGDGGSSGKKVRSAKERAAVAHARKRQAEAAEAAARSEVLLTETGGYLEAEGMERTYKFTQKQIADNVDISSAGKIFDLKLEDFGPYAIDYSADGRRLLLGGRKGHLATVDWRNTQLGCEIHVRETVRDVCWLHNESLFAVAQKKYAYIYDHTGAEVHCLRKHEEPTALGFLRHHFLLASTGMTGRVVYQDVTEGKVVGEHRSGVGPAHVLRVNPYNAVVHVGHGNGTVTLWAPQQSLPLAKLLCHRGPVQAVAVDGVHLATSGLDGRVKVWDVRALKELHEYVTARPAQSLDISQRGLLAAGCGPHVVVWKDALATQAASPYMRRMLPSTSVQTLRFAPYEDVLGYGHSGGMSSILVPGAG